MSTHIPPEVVPVIRDAINRHPEGATVMDILAAFPEPPARRSLQRWLGNLVKEGTLMPKPPVDPADPFRYLLPDVVASVAGASHGQRNPPAAGAPDDPRGQRSDPVAGVRGQRSADAGHANAGHETPTSQEPEVPRLPDDGQRSDSPVASVPNASHGQGDPAAAVVADESRGQRPGSVASVGGQRSADAAHATASPEPKRRRRPASPSSDDQPSPSSAVRHPPSGSDPDTPAGTVEAVAADLLQRAFGHRPKSGEPVRKHRRQTLPLVLAGAFTTLLLGLIGRMRLNGWTLAGIAVLALAAAAFLIWKSLRATPAPDPDAPAAASISGSQRSSLGGMSLALGTAFQGRRTLRLAAAGLAAAALVAGFLAYRQWGLRPPIGTVQAFLASRLAPLPVRIAALDVTFAAPGNAGVRLTYRAAVENTAPLYTTEATSVYLQNQPGKLPAALTHTDMLLDGVGGDRLRSAAGPAPTPDPRTVLLLKTAVPIGTPAVTSGTLFAWRTDNGWKFTVEGETPPRFAGEPRPTDKPTFILDDPKDVAALGELLQRTLAYTAKVRAADMAEQAARAAADVRRPTADDGSVRTADNQGRATDSAPRQSQNAAAVQAGRQRTDGGQRLDAQIAQVAAGVSAAVPPSSVSRKEPQDAQENRTTADRGQTAADAAPGEKRKAVGVGGDAGSRIRDAGSQSDVVAGVPPAVRTVASNSAPPSAVSPMSSDSTTPSVPVGVGSISAFQHLSFSAFPTSTGAYALVDGRWIPLAHAQRQKVQSTPQALTMKLLTTEYAEDALAGRTPKPPKDPIANVILTGADDIPTAPAGDLVLVYIGELKLPAAATLAKYPELKTYPEIELAPVQLASNATRYVPLYLIAPGALAYGPSRVPATLEHPRPNAYLLRAHELTPGTYALACGSAYYEVNVR